MSPARLSPRFWFVIVPLCTLVLGWQMGQLWEHRQLQGLQQKVESLYMGTTHTGAVLKDPEKEANLSLFWRVWNLLNDRYVDPAKLNQTALVNGAIRGLVAGVGDPYTIFMTPTESQDFTDSLDGHLQGIGAELNMKDGQVVVVTPLKGSPAEQAGLRAQDIIVAVDGKSLENMTLTEVVTHIRGMKGTVVVLTVQRKGADAPLKLSITRDDIHVPSAEFEVKTTPKGNVGLLTVNQFGSDTLKEIRNLLAPVNTQGLKGLIIDLRNNGGGYLDGAVELSSLFLREGTVVSVVGRTPPGNTQSVDGKPILPDLPLVVLINQGTASASEIVSGALQDHKRATIVGMKSFGKGTVQEVIDLPGGASLKMTIARWLTPNGHDLGKQGVTPDIAVDLSDDDVKNKRDPQLDAAILWLTEHRTIKSQSATGAVMH